MSVSPSAPFSVVIVSGRHTVSGVCGRTHCRRPSAITPGCGRSTEKCTSGAPGSVRSRRLSSTTSCIAKPAAVSRLRSAAMSAAENAIRCRPE